ncbi:MAG: hypothetical protein IGS03_04390 [Candidatus Sericytochromatia bacterium]|nr:hypothetical protein [Candidatus Sericytochromatia bacterium]
MNRLLLLLCLAGLSACTSPTTASGPISSPAANQPESSEDAALKQELERVLKQLEPGIQAHTTASALTLEHARQLAENPADTNFRIQQDHYDPLPPSALSQRLLREGVYASDNLVSAFLSDGDAAQIVRRFREQVEPAIGRTPFTHYGLAVVQRGRVWFVSLVLLTEIVSLEPLALTYTSPTEVPVKGRITKAGYSAPQLLMTLPSGEVVDIPAQVQGNAFEARLPLTQTGLYSFEVDVQGPLGPLPACNFVLAVGRDYPAPASTASRAAEAIDDLAQARENLLALVNADRRSMNLSQLNLDPALSQAAQSHSEDMVQNGFLGHNSPTHGTPQQQAARFGVSDLVAQNISVSRSLANAQQELMSSPAHRRTLLDPSHTHAGFGVQPGPDGFLYVTQKFVQRQLIVDPLPASIRQGETLNISGERLSTPGYVAVFINNDVQGEPVDLTQNQRFSIPVTLRQTGPVRLRIGFSPPPENNVFNFSFYNIWDLDVQP